jgi:DNA-binding transcriptional LysR family regulator
MLVKMSEIDLNHIRAFVRLVQLGSVTKAAAFLKQPKSRLSRHLASLEEDLGVQLIHRTTRQFQLTEMGKRYYERCHSLVEGLESLTQELSESSAEVAGWIKVTASDDMGILQLPQMLEEFVRAYPKVQFEVLLSQSYVDLVQESVDVALRVGVLKDSSLKARKVGVVRSIFVASPGFIERYKPDDDVSEALKNSPIVAMTPGKKIEIYKTHDSKQKLTLKIDPVGLSNNPMMVREMAVSGRGIGFVPEFLCAEHLRSGKLVHLYKSWQSEDIPISIVTIDQKEVPLRLKKFLDFFSKRLKETLPTV